MQITERSYNSKVIRPKPIVFTESDGSLVIIATAWGHAAPAQKMVEDIAKYMSAARADVEVTSPFEFLGCLSDEVNYLRTAILIANEVLYRGENKAEYRCGVEVTVLYKKNHQLAWAHVGAPALLLKRPHLPLQPLSTPVDFSTELFSFGEEPLPPLPSQLLGLEPTCDIKVGHFYSENTDQIVLLAGSRLSQSLWVPGVQSGDLSEITQSIIEESPHLPFWLGVVDFKDEPA